jgi:hypothetical protein
MWWGQWMLRGMAVDLDLLKEWVDSMPLREPWKDQWKDQWKEFPLE